MQNHSFDFWFLYFAPIVQIWQEHAMLWREHGFNTKIKQQILHDIGTLPFSKSLGIIACVRVSQILHDF